MAECKVKVVEANIFLAIGSGRAGLRELLVVKSPCIINQMEY